MGDEWVSPHLAHATYFFFVGKFYTCKYFYHIIRVVYIVVLAECGFILQYIVHKDDVHLSSPTPV